MQDNALIRLIGTVLNAGFIAQGFTAPGPSNTVISSIAVKQDYQPTNQGVNTQPTCYLHKIGDHRYGFLRREDIWDRVHEQMVHTESQYYETMFQVSALSIQNPLTPDQPTASDICNIAAAIMQSDATRATLRAQGVGILRIEDVRNPYFMDDKNRFEASPSFDFTLEHEQVIISTSPTAETIELHIDRV